MDPHEVRMQQLGIREITVNELRTGKDTVFAGHTRERTSDERGEGEEAELKIRGGEIDISELPP